MLVLFGGGRGNMALFCGVVGATAGVRPLDSHEKILLQPGLLPEIRVQYSK